MISVWFVSVIVISCGVWVGTVSMVSAALGPLHCSAAAAAAGAGGLWGSGEEGMHGANGKSRARDDAGSGATEA